MSFLQSWVVLYNRDSISKMPPYPVLSESLRSQLAAIEPSEAGLLIYHPSKVTLRGGRTLERVYVVAATAYLSRWGLYPEQDPHKLWCRIEDVVSIELSSSRLPAKFANKVYKAGESGMGYHVFTVVFSDGTTQAYLAGNSVDFIEYPRGKGPSDIAGILPHVGRDQNPNQPPNHHWCLFSDS